MRVWQGNPDELRAAAKNGAVIRCIRGTSVSPEVRNGKVVMIPCVVLHYTYDGERHGELARLIVQERRYVNDKEIVDLSDTIWSELVDDGLDVRLVKRSGSF